MPRSKRNKVISLTKVDSKGRKLKQKHIDTIRLAVDEYTSIYTFSYENMRTVNFTDVRADFKDSKLFMGKNSISQLALGRTPEEEYKDNLRSVSKQLKGSTGLLFTNKTKKDVVKYFKDFSRADFAKSGTIPDEDYTMVPQILNQFPVAMLDELRKLGMKVEIDDGKVALRESFCVCTAGTAITPEQARILVKMERKLINFTIKLECCWENGDFTEF
jgi:mRNA turnover protein 4